jgi:hypothetical protein
VNDLVLLLEDVRAPNESTLTTVALLMKSPIANVRPGPVNCASST